ncbi:Cell shape-determining protein MreC [Marinomonas spartinae]|uniref:Cell shape-determining protein MreC n=1 Tax=Marinomonas spartinae TaxID=1792290 RepID=A0A1A8TCN3_9GAMM|nr:rod shape-determining protein MreC [Marinomonas spartinae]SBS30023.1 Cell shape-determining protein MreC [Marinomonas spartinae]SBS37039.1 Cell shape-determining protein MreC [Marinomonas spartinae]
MLVILSVAMIVGDVRYSIFAPIRPYLTWLVAPIQVVVNTPQQILFWANDHLQSREDLVKENQKLNQELLLLRSRLQQFASLQAENVRLRELLDASQRVDEKVVLAEVIGFDQNAYSQKVLINKGFSSGAYVGEPVLDATGVFGQIVETSAYTSRVLLIADASHFLPVQLARTGFRGVLRGIGDLKHMKLMSVPQSADIRKGDILTTSGLGKRFPAGYPVGVVREVKHIPGQPYADVDVVPLAQLGRSRHVMLIDRPKSERDK